MLSTRTPRLALCLALAVTAGTGLAASAAKAPRTSDTGATFYLRQEGCGSTGEPGRLEPRPGGDSATGCGTVGGLPFDELVGEPEPFTSSGKGLPVHLDPSRKVTGQLAAGSWTGNGTGGVGTVTFDVSLVGTLANGEEIDFGSTTVDGAAAPGQDVVTVPFELEVPDLEGTAVVKSLVLEVLQRGANLGMSAKQYDGESWLVLPTRSGKKK